MGNNKDYTFKPEKEIEVLDKDFETLEQETSVTLDYTGDISVTVQPCSITSDCVIQVHEDSEEELDEYYEGE